MVRCQGAGIYLFSVLMRKFLIKILIFLLFPTAYFGINALVNFYMISGHKAEISQKRILIAGDSHPMTSLNPELFESANNISQSAEPYVITFWKLKKIFAEARPDTLLLGFAPHNFSGFNDQKFSDRLWADVLFKRIYPISNFESIRGKIDIDYTNLYRSIWKQISFYPRLAHGNYIGKFDFRKAGKISNAQRLIDDHFYYNNKEAGVSRLSINYLDSISHLCNQYQVNLVLVNNPVHKSYLNSIPKINRNVYQELKSKWSSKVLIIDKTASHYPDSLFFNADHLNGAGAERFTREVKAIIKSAPN